LPAIPCAGDIEKTLIKCLKFGVLLNCKKV